VKRASARQFRTNMNPPDAPKPLPAGFKLHAPAPGTMHIEFANERRSCLVIFLGVWMAGWTVACVFLLSQLLAGQRLAPNEPGSFMNSSAGAWLFATPFFVAEIFMGLLLLWLWHGRTELLHGENDMRLVQRFFRFPRQKFLRRNDITRVIQVKDGGEGDDSFPTWGLKVEVSGGDQVMLLWRQPIEHSDWLGPLVAEWAGKPFEPAKDRS